MTNEHSRWTDKDLAETPSAEYERRVWMDPGDGTLIPVTLLGPSIWPGAWRVRDEGGKNYSTSRVVNENGQPLKRAHIDRSERS